MSTVPYSFNESVFFFFFYSKNESIYDTGFTFLGIITVLFHFFFLLDLTTGGLGPVLFIFLAFTPLGTPLGQPLGLLSGAPSVSSRAVFIVDTDVSVQALLE